MQGAEQRGGTSPAPSDLLVRLAEQGSYALGESTSSRTYKRTRSIGCCSEAFYLRRRLDIDLATLRARTGRRHKVESTDICNERRVHAMNGKIRASHVRGDSTERQRPVLCDARGQIKQVFCARVTVSGSGNTRARQSHLLRSETQIPRGCAT